MTVTFNLESENPEILFISQVRSRVGDDVVGAGIKPDGANFSDEEIADFKVVEGASLGRVQAAVLGANAARFGRLGMNKEDKLASDYRSVAKELRTQAQALRNVHGYGEGSGGGRLQSFVVQPKVFVQTG